MRKVLLTVSVVGLALGGSVGCATKKFVNTRVDEVNERVGALSTAVEENEERTRENTARIGEVDKKADRADERAGAAGRAASDARSAADAVGARTDAIDRSMRRLVYEVVISDSQGNFRFNQAALPDEAKGMLDKMIADISAEPRNVFFEIEGHTDSTGPEQVNERIGLERAEAVKRYLYETHSVPLHKMNVISYGETKPAAPNNTRDGRAQNRRVVIRVVS